MVFQGPGIEMGQITFFRAVTVVTDIFRTLSSCACMWVVLHGSLDESVAQEANLSVREGTIESMIAFSNE